MGMLRTSLIVGAILFALPSPPPDPAQQAQAPVSSVAYLAAAAEAVADVKSFCARRPFVCDTAGQLAATVERKAKYSAKLIYEWANESGLDQARIPQAQEIASTVDDIQTGDTTVAGALTFIEAGPFLIPADPQLAAEAGQG